MYTQWKKISAMLSATLMLSASVLTALAQDHNHSNNDSPAQLTLNHGQKWNSDANLRLGMSRIRDALSSEMLSIQSGNTTAEQYQVLSKRIKVQITFMVQNCKLDREADDMLHLILGDIIAGTDNMIGQGNDNARKGAKKIAYALDNYGTYFAHPGWYGVKAP
ncbi:hypothetical protein [Sulfurirhabdus autotrophica]|uniref:DnrO protein n=1 Tax=Sulfurirhabdus autotrophica TaxID=1706046 RepID=A0A4R3YIY1_9PROT|nr:hypothetical protein [Sulfurirhabdus autotrophica]TCV90643.1 hypothetical protein EDC63_101617 [Sulfurirhabdus autotrophica]